MNEVDPLRASVSLPLHNVLFPFGFAVQIKTNQSAVMRAAERSWGAFLPKFRESPVEVRVVVSEYPFRRRPNPPIFRAQSNLLVIVSDAHNFACCDLNSGVAFACVTAAALKNLDYFRFHFLDAMVYSLLDTRHLVAVHAACIEKNGHGFLLVGDSGAGKTSLAYAAARRGWTYISDDATSIVRATQARTVVGNFQSFRFRPNALSLFPELHGTVALRSGKPTVEIRTESMPNVKVAPQARIDFVVFLDRQNSADASLAIEPVSHEYALRRLLQNPWPPELMLNEERLTALERLLEARLCRLTYAELEQAVDGLERVATKGLS